MARATARTTRAWARSTQYAPRSGNTTTVSFGASGSVTVHYDAWGRVVETYSGSSSVAGPNGAASYTTYSYNALGRQITTNNYTNTDTLISGTQTYFDGANPIEVRMQDNTLLATNVWSPADGRLILRDAVATVLSTYTGLTITPNSAGGIQRLYPMTDGIGSIVAVADPTGTVQERYTYTADGLPQALTAAWAARSTGWRHRPIREHFGLELALSRPAVGSDPARHFLGAVARAVRGRVRPVVRSGACHDAAAQSLGLRRPADQSLSDDGVRAIRRDGCADGDRDWGGDYRRHCDRRSWIGLHARDHRRGGGRRGVDGQQHVRSGRRFRANCRIGGDRSSRRRGGRRSGWVRGVVDAWGTECGRRQLCRGRDGARRACRGVCDWRSRKAVPSARRKDLRGLP